jgi:hypothetical protein
LDQFWFCKDGRTLAQAVQAYEDYYVVYANWTMFGSAGHDRHPVSLRMCLTQKSPALGPHGCTKYICRTRAITKRRSIGMHKVFGACSSRTISDNGLLQINHYPLQSREYFQDVKMPRGDAINPALDNIRDWHYFETYDRPCVVDDHSLAEQVSRFKENQSLT